MQFISGNCPPSRSFDSTKRLLALLLLIFALGSFAFSGAASAEELMWKDVETGLLEARSSHRYALADVYTDWCHWCKKLDQDTFSKPSMIRYLNSKFVCIKANAEDNAEGQKLAGEYGVRGFPCALVFDPSGKFIGKISGFRDAGDYEQALNQLIAHPNQNATQ